MEFTQDRSYSSLFAAYRATIPTGGDVRIVPTSGTHLHFDANTHCLGGPDRCYVVCRGVEYGASLHFYLRDGQWLTTEAPHVTHCATLKDASPAARRWIAAEAAGIVADFAAQHPEAFTQAEEAKRVRDLDSKQAERAKLAAQLAKLDAEILELGGSSQAVCGYCHAARPADFWHCPQCGAC